MVAKFQRDATFFRKIFFSIGFLHCVRVENRKKLWKKFLNFSTRWRHSPKGLVRIDFSTMTSKVFNFFQSVFCVRFVLLIRMFCGKKFFSWIGLIYKLSTSNFQNKNYFSWFNLNALNNQLETFRNFWNKIF
jgi:hypothetical protein